MKDLYVEGLLAGCSTPLDVEGFIDIVWGLALGVGPFRVAFETRSSDPKWPYGSDYHWFRSREEVARTVNALYSRFETGGDVGLSEEDARAKCHLLYLPSDADDTGVTLPELNRLGGEHSWVEWQRFGRTGTSAIWIGGLYLPSPRQDALDQSVSPYLRNLAGLVRHLLPLTHPQLAWCGEMGDTREIAVRTTQGRLWFLNWINLFGPQYLGKFGKDFLLGAPGYRRELLPGDYVHYQVTEGFAPWDATQPSPTAVEAYFSAQTEANRVVYRPWLKKALALSPMRTSFAGRGSDQGGRRERRGVFDRLLIGKPKTAMTGSPEAYSSPEGLRRIAEKACGDARRALGIDLDFSPRSVAVLDNAVDMFFDPSETPPPTTIASFGAYVGEVVIRNLGGRWRPSQDWYDCAVVDLGSIAELYPMRRVAKRFEEGSSASLVAWYAAVESSANG